MYTVVLENAWSMNDVSVVLECSDVQTTVQQATVDVITVVVGGRLGAQVLRMRSQINITVLSFT